jgi:predicted RNA-binding Zn ribbon-like protein
MSTVIETQEPPSRNAAPPRLELVREFINTAELDEDKDLLTDVTGLRSWFVDKGLLGAGSRVTNTDLTQTIEFRESLRDILSAHTAGIVSTGAVRLLDAAVKKIPMRLRVDDTGWVRVAAAGKDFDGALGELLARVYEAMEDGSWQRMKACNDETCRWAFFDHSKNRSAHWCDMAVCGNRAKVNAFRQRQAATESRVRGPRKDRQATVNKKA